MKHLCRNVMEEQSFTSDAERALRDGFARTDTQFISLARMRGMDDGSTAVLALVRGDTVSVANGARARARYLSICNLSAAAGDSRCVLVQRTGQVVELSHDHKPNIPSERQRIESAGGSVVFWGVWRTEGVLAVSRSIGDYRFKRYVVGDPDVLSHVVTPNDKFLVLASDGLWCAAALLCCPSHSCNNERRDVVQSRDIPGEIRSVDVPQEAAERLMNVAFARGSTDNICVLVVDLRPLAAKAAAAAAAAAAAVAASDSRGPVSSSHAVSSGTPSSSCAHQR